MVTPRQARKRRGLLARQWPLLVGLALVAVFGVIAWRVYLGLGDLTPPAPPAVQEISLVQPPPPPPPPPNQPPPPPEKVQEVVEPEPEPEPEPVAEEAPPSEELGLDAEGVAGSDGFGLKARKGGRDLLAGGGGNAIVWYGQKLGSELSEAMRALLAERLHRRGFSAVAALWVAADGRVTRAELAAGSGDPEVDAALRSALATLDLRLPQAPPRNMPQPVKIRVRARG